MSIMTRILFLTLAVALAFPALCSAAPDKKGCKGDALFTRMPGTFVKDCKASDFDAQPFHCGPGKPVNLEGRYLMTRYESEAGAAAATAVQVLRNHKQAASDIGAATVSEDKRYACFRLTKDGKEVTAEVDTAWNRGYVVRVIEKAAMKQEVAGNADIFLKSIRDTGHAAVYGIYFDTGLAALKPESGAALHEIAGLLKQDPKLMVFVVGHTDNVGAMAGNMKLSEDRAGAVVKALAQEYGVDAGRLKAAGVGPLVPVSTNRTEDGRAKNRRVELVER
jgi:outer membrane protein OmpA-like peptidoglycan-associated protein